MSSCSRLAVLGLLFVSLGVQSSTAQSERRHVLGETISFDVEKRASLKRSDFLGKPRDMNRMGGTPSASSGDGTHPQIARRSVAPNSNSTSQSLLAPIGLGLVGGTVGLLAGGVVGGQLAKGTNCNSLGCLSYPFLGALIGETIGLSSGVHLGTNESNYLLTLLGGALGTTVALGLANATDSPEALILGPAVQLGVTIPIARSTQ